MAQEADDLRRRAEERRRRALEGLSAQDLRDAAEARRVAEVRAVEPGERRTPTVAGIVTGTDSTTKAPAAVRLPMAVGQGARDALEGAAGTLGATGNLVARIPGMGFLQNPYGFEGAERAGEQLFGPAFEPSGRLEEALSLGGEFVGGAGFAGAGRQATIRGLPVARNVADVLRDELAPAGLSIAGQQATFGENYQGTAELIGGLAGGINASAQRALPEPGAAFISNTLSSATAEDFNAARRLSARAREAGFPLTPDEALKSRELQRLAAQAQARPQGREAYRVREERLDGGALNDLSDMAESQPGRFRSLMQRFYEENLTRTDRPIATVSEKAQEAAQDLRRRRTAAVTPYYEAAFAPDQNVSTESVQDLVSQIDQLATRYGEGAPEVQQLRQLRQRLVRTNDAGEEVGLQTNAGALDRAYQEFEDRINIKPGDPRSTLAEGVGATLQPVRLLREITEENPNISAGRRIYRRYTRRLVEPLLRGPLGALSRNDPDQLKRLNTLVDQVVTGADFETGDFAPFVNRLAAVEGGQDALEGLLVAYMDNVVEQALGGTARGPRPDPSAYFSSQIEGGARQNLNAIFDALDQADQRTGRPRPPNRRLAFRNLMSVLDATRGPQSSTPPSLTDTDILNQANASILTRLLQVTRPLATPASAVSQEVAQRRNRAIAREAWEVIGRALSDTSEEGINRIERMARSGGRGGEALRAANEILLVRTPFVENRFEDDDADNGNQ